MSNEPKPIGDKWQYYRGWRDYFLKPDLIRQEIGPFNGQENRQKIFLELVEKFRFRAIFETGTYRGLTTKYMYGCAKLPVYSAELNPRFYSYAKTRLRKEQRITIYNKDSRDFLEGLFEDEGFCSAEIFCYLDAHWCEDLPLSDELDIIFKHCANAVVMIDDFMVPGDEGYGYDDYGKGKKLSLDYLVMVIEKHSLKRFFPVCRGIDETGARRGSVVLVKSRDIEMQMRQLETLRYDHDSVAG